MPQRQATRARRHAAGPADEVFIPDKLYFRIREVSELARTPAYVLRYWETEFPSLCPGKSSTGHRLYRRNDVEMVLEIRRLLYEQGFTIEGARRHLAPAGARLPAETRKTQPAPDGAALRAVRHELESILTLLSRKC